MPPRKSRPPDRHMQTIPTLAQLQAAGPTAAGWLDDVRRHLAFCWKLASTPKTRAGIEARIALLDVRERELEEDSAIATEASK